MTEIECRVCGESLKTKSIDKVTAFDREHTKTCGPNGDPA